MPITNQSIIELIIQYEVNGQKLMNTFHYKNRTYTSGTSEVDYAGQYVIANSINNPGTVLGDLIPLLGSNVTVKQVSAQLVYPTRLQKAVQLVGFAGTYGDTCTAQNVSAAIERRGAVANKHNVGGIRVGGVPFSAYSAGLIVVGYRTPLNALAATMMNFTTDPLNADEWDPVILNKTKIPDTDPPKYVISGSVPQTSTRTFPELRVMRRRTVGLGI